VIDFASGEHFVVPEWAMLPPDPRPARCRSCQASILWVVTVKAGKRAPIDPDGISHFATCPEAERWRKPKAHV